MDKEKYKTFKYRFVNYKLSTVTFYNQDGDILLREPSLVAVNAETGKVLAMGKEAQKECGVVGVVVGSTLRNGVIADFELAKKMFRVFLKETTGHRQLFKPKIAFCIPKDKTPVEHQAYSELIYSLGAKSGSALIIEAPFEEAISVIPNSYKIIIEISEPEE